MKHIRPMPIEDNPAISEKPNRMLETLTPVQSDA
jgi:hypothetical protein